MAGYGIATQQSSESSLPLAGGSRWTSNEQLDQRDRDAAQARSNLIQMKPEVISLGGHIRKGFTIAITSKQTVQDEMLRSLRQRNGVHEASVLQAIRAQGGTNIYMMITDTKCRALESHLKDIMLPVGERPFEAERTQVVDIRPEVAQEAWAGLVQELQASLVHQYGEDKAREIFTPELLRTEGEELEKELRKQLNEVAEIEAKEISTKIDDELKEGGWYTAISDFINDLSTYPTAFIIGPIRRKRKVKKWTPIPGTNLSRISFVDKIVKEYHRFDPFDVYPGPAAKDIQDGDLYLRMRYNRKSLAAMKGVPGFDSDTIDHVLELYGVSGFRDFIYSDTEYADLQNRPQETQDPTGLIDGVKVFDSVQGFLLRHWGMTNEQIPNPFDDYNIDAIAIGNYVIMARINENPMGKRGIYSASFKKKNGSVWGQTVPYIIRSIQNFCNSAAIAVCNNFALASGPQIGVNSERIPPGVDIQSIFPWKIWSFLNPKTGAAGSTDKPLYFFQPKLITKELMDTYDYFFKQGSEITGIPAYTSENLRGAGKTARGLAMLRSDAARGIRAVARNIDQGIITPSVENHWLINILEDDSQAQGDINIIARASDFLVQQEQLEAKRYEVLEMSNNPVDLEIMGLDGRAELWKANLRSLKTDVDKIIPSKEDMIRRMVQTQIEQFIMQLAQSLGMAPEELMAIMQQQPQGTQQAQPSAPRQIPARTGEESI